MKKIEKFLQWKSPDDQTINQIDYFSALRKFRNAIIDVSTIPTAD